ncbi:MAG TPA: CDP-alcohol phosphatidyltransferase family protein [Candidatus Aminicenantes bacterium]|nr:CDP-alcohol phosphatidyltransferase family protein [Candidatus Aminicenantes bacterium]
MADADMPSPPERFDYRKSLKNVRSYPFLHKYFPIDRFFVRPCASLIVRAVYRTGVTPNHLTLASFFLALAAGAVYLMGRPVCYAAGGALAMLSTVFDNADGMLARAKDMTSRYGAFLDLFLDRIADFAVLAGITFGVYRASLDPRILMLGLMTIGLYFLQVSLYYLANVYAGNSANGEGAEAKNLAVFFILVFSLAGWPAGVLIGVGLMAAAGTVIKLVSFLRQGREPAAAPARSPAGPTSS